MFDFDGPINVRRLGQACQYVAASSPCKTPYRVCDDARFEPAAAG